MKMYLSSYQLGNETNRLVEMMPANKKVGYIFNAIDAGAAPGFRIKYAKADIQILNRLGFDCVELDLRDYFGKQKKLYAYIETLGAIWVSGGNVFILRQAFKLSGFDEILVELQQHKDFLYGAYSAGVCVLSPTLDGYHLVDDAAETPYKGLDEPIWDGIGILDYTFLPHFESDHSESSAINKVLAYCREKAMPYKTLRDGEVIIIE